MTPNVKRCDLSDKKISIQGGRVAELRTRRRGEEAPTLRGRVDGLRRPLSLHEEEHAVEEVALSGERAFKAIKRFFYLADFFHIFRYLLVIAKVHLPYLFSHQLPIVSDQQSADVTFCQA
jgi:hypothetical protein